MDSPLEEYPASWTSIANAASETPDHMYSRSRAHSGSRSGSIYSKFSSGASDNSGGSGVSNTSAASFSSRASRRGRRNHVKTADSSSKPARKPLFKTKKSHQYFCTFCPKGFSGRYEWNRHEESVHLSRTMWICNFDQTGQLAMERPGLASQNFEQPASSFVPQPESPINVNADQDECQPRICTICSFTQTSPVRPDFCNACLPHDFGRPLNLESDGMVKESQKKTYRMEFASSPTARRKPDIPVDCTHRPQRDRTFYRRDNLVQHVLLIHKTKASIRQVDLCKVAAVPLEVTNLALRCGFCGFRSATWEVRCSHLSSHFSEGVDMSGWWLQRRDHSLGFVNSYV